MSDRPIPSADLNVERLARMASVDGSWWHDCDRQAHRPGLYWRHGVVGGLIGGAIGWAMLAFAMLS